VPNIFYTIQRIDIMEARRAEAVTRAEWSSEIKQSLLPSMKHLLEILLLSR
jgi:hypothetical protein